MGPPIVQIKSAVKYIEIEPTLIISSQNVILPIIESSALSLSGNNQVATLFSGKELSTISS